MDSNSNLQAVVAGHICLDITPGFTNSSQRKLDEIFSPGKSVSLSGVNISTGGAVSNTGITLSILGIQTKLMCKVGKDYFGETVMKILKKKGINKGVRSSKLAPTSYSIVISPPGVDRLFLHEPGVNDLFDSSDIDFDTVKKSKLFHFGYPTAMRKVYMNDGAELIKIFEKVKTFNVTTSLDLSLTDPDSEPGKVNWKYVLKRVLPFIDIFTPSLEEIFSILRNNEYAELCKASQGIDMIDAFDMNLLQELGEELLNLGVKIAVIKCGKKGYYIRTQNSGVLAGLGNALPADLHNWSGRELFEETYHVDRVMSTTGSGDTSIAGFLASLLTGKTIEESIKTACAVGALCVQTFDALSGIKSMEETSSIIKAGWRKNNITLNDSYWNFDSSQNVWVGKKDSILIKV